MYDVLNDISRWLNQGEDVGLATVISTWGSAPRGVGAKMAFTPTGKISGSVSGGCVEGAVFESGMQAIMSGIPRLLHFGVTDETAFEVGLACGGQIEVFVQKLHPGLFELVRTSIQARRSLAVVSVIAGPIHLLGKQLACVDGKTVISELGDELDQRAAQLASEFLRQGEPGSVQTELGDGEAVRLFVDVILPPPTLVMVGGVHIAITLASLARALGYRTVVVDPRQAFASPERFPHVDRLVQAWPDEAFAEIPLTPNTCVAILTHDPKIDDPAVKLALNSPAFYVGVLGSRKTHQKRRRRLLAEGLRSEDLDRLHAPIGLDLGGKTPEETALAVMAEIVATRHHRA